MKNYYWSDGNRQFGPFTYDELKREGLSRSTLVWTESMEDWLPASEVDELKALFASTPPPLMSEPESQDFPVSHAGMHVPSQAPKNWLVESILVTILCCLPFGIVGIVNAARVDSKFQQGDYYGAEKASKDAGKWTKIGFFVGIGFYLLYAIYMVAMIVIGIGGGL